MAVTAPNDCKRATAIVAACQVAGYLDRAAAYVADGTPLETVQRDLLLLVCTDRGLPANPTQALQAEYVRNAALYTQRGITEEQFLQIGSIESGSAKLDYFERQQTSDVVAPAEQSGRPQPATPRESFSYM